MREKTTNTGCGRGIAIAVIIAFLLGALLPLFGSTVQASDADDFTSDNCIDSSLVEPSTDLPFVDSTDITPFVSGGNVYGLVKYEDKTESGQTYEISSGGSLETGPGKHTYLPLCFTRVRIFNVNPSGSDVDITYDFTTAPLTVQEVYTNDVGYFYFNIVPQEWFFSNQYYAMIESESLYAYVNSGQYTDCSDTITITDAELYEGITEFTFSSYPDHEAWNILDSITEEVLLLECLLGSWNPSVIDIDYPTNGEVSQYSPVFNKHVAP